jgi:hypothetical protein
MSTRPLGYYLAGVAFGLVLWYMVPYLLMVFRDTAVSEEDQNTDALAMAALSTFRDTLFQLTSPVHDALKTNPAFFGVYSAVIWLGILSLNLYAGWRFAYRREYKIGLQFVVLQLLSLLINSLVWFPAIRDYVDDGDDFWYYSVGVVACREETMFPARLAWFWTMAKHLELDVFKRPRPHHKILRLILIAIFMLYVIATRAVYSFSLFNAWFGASSVWYTINMNYVEDAINMAFAGGADHVTIGLGKPGRYEIGDFDEEQDAVEFESREQLANGVTQALSASEESEA